MAPEPWLIIVLVVEHKLPAGATMLAFVVKPFEVSAGVNTNWAGETGQRPLLKTVKLTAVGPGMV